MCTVTIIPLAGTAPGSFRLASNRDELRSRQPAEPPVQREFGPRSGLHPVDGDAGGTWVAANDAGLVMSLLNLNQAAAAEWPASGGLRSRGAIIPALLHHDRVAAAVTDVLQRDPSAQRPFRLVLVDRTERAVVRSDGRSIGLESRAADHGPFMITSSGLGDHLVEPPRRELFDRMFGEPDGDAAVLQEAFHRRHWPDRGHLSVSMDRPEALTLSRTVVSVDEDFVEMTYHEGPPHRAESHGSAAGIDPPVPTVRSLRRERRERTAG